jgi:centromere/kinetochore protein ZW10
LVESWSAMDALPVSKTCRAMKLLDIRSTELKSHVHEVLDRAWKDLVHIDLHNKVVQIQDDGNGNLTQHH